jgi:uncharacterized protein
VRALTFIFVLLLSTAAFAAPKFPALTGRVVDDAHVLSPGTVQTLDQMLADYEHGTTNQIVVVTIPSLQGTTIEDYGYQLGRTWQIGQKDKNNGALLIVAPKEHKVRIEVGYGLEPVLTDAASSAIVQGVILPAFRDGHMEQGIVDGAKAMLSVLGGNGVPSPQLSNQLTPESAFQGILIVIFFLGFLGFAAKHPWIALFMLNSSRFGSSNLSGSGWGGGGFSGGGGSFGGGGASGGW